LTKVRTGAPLFAISQWIKRGKRERERERERERKRWVGKLTKREGREKREESERAWLRENKKKERAPSSIVTYLHI
jgi:hypothetical protein